PILAEFRYIALSVDSATGLLWTDGGAGQRTTKIFRMLPPEAQPWGRDNGFEEAPQVDCRDQLVANERQPEVVGRASLVVISPAPSTKSALTPCLPYASQQ